MLEVGDDNLIPDDDIPDIPNIEVVYFKPEPASIYPFGASVLKWKIQGDESFTLKLEGFDVKREGQQVVQPTSSKYYTLAANLPKTYNDLELKSVLVSVQTQGCEILDVFANPESRYGIALRNGVKNKPEDNPKKYLRSDPVVKLSPDRIHFQLRLTAKYSEWYIPDVKVDIDASFGLSVQNGTIVAVSDEVSVDIYVPQWVYYTPFGFPIMLAIALAKDSTKTETRKGIKGLGELTNFHAHVYTPESKRFQKRIHTVHVEEGINNGAGRVLAEICHDNILQQLATISEYHPLKFQQE